MNPITQLNPNAWEDYKFKQDRNAWEELILKYAPMVKSVAGRLAAVLPKHLDYNDMLSIGTIGLMDAIEKYDITLGIKFETYAYSRIKGAILDGIRQADWVPRSIRKKAKKIQDTYFHLKQKLKRAPSDDEMSRALGIIPDEYEKWLSETGSVYLFSLEELIDKQPSNLMSPDELFEKSEVKIALASAIEILPEKEKMVISLYYYNGLTFKEIAGVLEVSESRVSQLHSKAILRLRGSLGKKKSLFI